VSTRPLYTQCSLANSIFHFLNPRVINHHHRQHHQHPPQKPAQEILPKDA
jgi:hypothetical protein